jgi:hypothetical protein
MKKAKPKLTAEQREVENKKHAERRRALDQRKREATAAEERQKAAEQLQLLQMEAKAKAMQEHAMLFYGHDVLAQLAATGAGTASGGSFGSSVTRPLPPRSTASLSTPFGYPPDAYEMMPSTGRFLYPPWDVSPEVGESMTGPSPSSIDLNRVPAAHSKAPRPMPAAVMAGAPCSTNCRVVCAAIFVDSGHGAGPSVLRTDDADHHVTFVDRAGSPASSH